MKSNIFCTIVFILIGNIVTAQEKQDSISNSKSDYWSLSYSAGIVSNINFNPGKTGFTYNVDASLTPANTVGIFMNFSVSTISENPKYYSGHYDQDHYPHNNINYVQLTIGPRFYSNNKNSFIDIGIGYYSLGGDNYHGINLGAGGKIKLSDDYALLLSGRLNCANVLEEDVYFYYGLFAGLEINNKKKISTGNSRSKISFAALAGTVGKDIRNLGNNSFSGEISYDLNTKFSLLINYLYGLSKVYNYDRIESQIQKSLTAGTRFYITGSNIKLFIEGLSGLSVSDKQRQYATLDPRYNYYNSYYTKNNYFGFTFGGGAEFKIMDNLSGVFKFDQLIQVKGSSFSGFFGGLKYRL